MNNRKLTALVAVLLVTGFAAGTLVAQTGTPLGSDTFDDVPAGHWADEAIGWAVQNGITSGVGDDRFDPNGTVTRAQIVTFLHRAVNLLEGNTPTTTTPTTAPATSQSGQSFDPNEHVGGAGWKCWMTNPPGPSTIECDADNFAGPEGLHLDLTVSDTFVCWVDQLGAIGCHGMHPWYWGPEPYTDDGLPDGTFTHISAGFWGVCAIRSTGEPFCWGSHTSLQEMTAPVDEYGRRAIDIALGLHHTCVLWQSEIGGSLYCYVNDQPADRDAIGLHGAFDEVWSRWDKESICAKDAWPPYEWRCWHHPDE